MISRQKIAAACDGCRQRKIKCNGKRPVCAPCSMRSGSECNYSRKKPARSRNRPLLPLPHVPRSPDVETTGDGAAPPVQIAAAQTKRKPREPVSAAIPQNVGDAPAEVSPSMISLSSRGQTTIGQSRGAMTISASPRDSSNTPGASQKASPGIEVFGKSSVDSFMRQVSSAIDARLGYSPEAMPDVDEVFTSRRSHVKSCTDVPPNPFDYTLPSRRVADELLQAYYDLVWAVLPIHDRTVFQESYDAAWLGLPTGIPERMLYCMMNLAFALGSQFSQSVKPSERKEAGEIFWKRARQLFEPQVENSASIEGVQSLLMMGLFLQSTCESYQCWMRVGSAIRMAQSLGLHLTATESRPSREIEISRRAWHGCVYMDRMVSMIFGRPSMIPTWLSGPVPLPVMIDDVFLDSQTEPSAIRPDGKWTVVAFFVKSLQLYTIVNDVLLDLYMCAEPAGKKGIHNLTSVLQFDDRLLLWYDSLPEHLQYSLDCLSDEIVFRRQQTVLRARFLHARILLLRPILAEFYLKQTSTGGVRSLGERGLSQTLIVECARLCFDAAHEIIDLIYYHFDFETVTGPVPAWWYAVLFVYTAAVVLLAERLRPTNHTQSCDQSPNSAGEDSFRKAVKLLQAWSKVGDSAKRCVAALEILSEKIDIGSSHDQTFIWRNESQQLEEMRGEKLGATPAINLTETVDSTLPVNLADFQLDIDDMLWSLTSSASIFF